jgi:hypothetical protein
VKADIEWVEKLENRLKRKIRITFQGQGRIKWQFKRSDEDSWNYDAAPSTTDWDTLEAKVEGLYNRRRIPLRKLELVRRLRKEAEHT